MFGIVRDQKNVSEDAERNIIEELGEEYTNEEPSSTTETNTTESVPTTEPEELEPEPESNTTGTEAVITGNAFLDYYFR